MNKIGTNPIMLLILMILFGLAVFYLESRSTDGSLLFTLVFWIAIVQGPIALVAVADLAKGKWIAPLKRSLLSLYPMILFRP